MDAAQAAWYSKHMGRRPTRAALYFKDEGDLAIMYRGQSGMWSWLIHRVTGVAILLFLLVHIVDITMLGFGPTVYNNALNVFATPLVRVISLALVAAVMYHAFNGLRIVVIDFWPQGAKYQKPMFWGAMVLTLAGFIGMGFAIIQPVLQGCPSHLCGN